MERRRDRCVVVGKRLAKGVCATSTWPHAMPPVRMAGWSERRIRVDASLGSGAAIYECFEIDGGSAAFWFVSLKGVSAINPSGIPSPGSLSDTGRVMCETDLDFPALYVALHRGLQDPWVGVPGSRRCSVAFGWHRFGAFERAPSDVLRRRDGFGVAFLHQHAGPPTLNSIVSFPGREVDALLHKLG